MKTNVKPIILAVGLGLLLLAPQKSSGFYNPSTGQWISRDPLGEEAAQNLSSFVCNDSVNLADAFGLATIRVGFGFDQSAGMDHLTLGLIEAQISTFQSLLAKCCEMTCCKNYDKAKWCNIDIKRVFDSNRKNKPLPPGKVYNLDDAAIVAFVTASIGNINVKSAAQVVVLITRASISQTWDGTKVSPNGNTFPTGILLKIATAQASALAHETGHVVKYVGDASDKVHSTEADNVMSRSGGSNPDCQWCDKVAGLAK